MDKVFPWQATVVSSKEFLKAIGAKDAKYSEKLGRE